MKFLLLVFLCMTSISVMALEVDEKLTIRILKSSDSRKTLMINRGTEDGLVEGDHAKFIVTSGIVARGFCAKISPTRSVWSVYRLVNADLIVNDAVMTIKITTPVKVTKDESQSLVQEDTPTRAGTGTAELGIPLADGAQDITPAEEAGNELKGMVEGEVPTTLVEKTKEVFGFINISGLTSNSKVETGEDSFNSSHAYHHIGLGGEFYPQREREWYSKFSLAAGLNVMRLSSQAYNGASAANDVTEFSLGANWHPTKLPSLVMEFIPYFNFGIQMGSVKSSYNPGSNDSGGAGFASNGSTSAFSFGFGYKYYISNGFGARVILDYYMRTEKYQEDELTNKHNRIIGGPRLMVGLSYRFGK
jgi:hypothetical protein